MVLTKFFKKFIICSIPCPICKIIIRISTNAKNIPANKIHNPIIAFILGCLSAKVSLFSKFFFFPIQLFSFFYYTFIKHFL